MDLLETVDRLERVSKDTSILCNDLIRLMNDLQKVNDTLIKELENV